jgi:predicted cation transporter
MKEKKKRKNLKKAGAPLRARDSLNIVNRKRVNSDIVVEYDIYERHTCVILSYVFLVVALFCIMIASVAQYFSLNSSCYSHLEDNVAELLLGYKILAFMSVTVLGLLACLVSCLLFAIIANCFNRERDS